MLFCVPPPSAMLVYILLATWHLDIIVYMCYNIYIRLRNSHSGYILIAFIMPHEMRLESNIQKYVYFNRTRNRTNHDGVRIRRHTNHHRPHYPERHGGVLQQGIAARYQPPHGAVRSKMVKDSRPQAPRLARIASVDKLEDG